MKPTEFEGQNVVFAKDQPQYQPLPAFKNDSQQGEVVQCWQLSDEEIETIVKTKRMWVMQMTFNAPLQPILLSTEPLVNTEATSEAKSDDEAIEDFRERQHRNSKDEEE